LGPYEIVARIGAGGMGEVYRARDLRLDRTVAIKVLPAELSLNPLNRERLLREARAVSNLNHPNICTLHDIGSEAGVDYLVMEHLEGDTLQQRLSKGPLPEREAFRYAIEIADALDLAHRSGVVHRDLKPGNVILTRSGAKLLDFGLAKVNAVRPQGDETVTTALTSEGSIVGTLQYMAPEQLEGKEVTPRADIFAFGAVLYEMFTGQRAFTGESAASIIASILTAEPVARQGTLGGSALDRVIRKCLAKKPERRWQTASDLKDELEWVASGGAAAPVAAEAAKPRGTKLWIAATALLALLAAGLAWQRSNAPAEMASWSLAVTPPPGAVFAFNQNSASFAVSPDGRLLVFPALSRTGSQLWIRDLTSGSNTPLPGTDDGHSPFWSPDGRNVGFFAGGKLKKTRLTGSPEVICDAADGFGASWNQDGVIIFTPRSLSVVHRVSASGGVATPITTLDPARHENAHYWPVFLPDGRHFLYWSRDALRAEYDKSGLLIASLDDSPTLIGRPVLVKTFHGAAYAPSRQGSRGHLVYSRGRSLVAQPFDSSALRLEGEAIPVVEDVGTGEDGTRVPLSASATGVLVYGEPDSDRCRLTWSDRTGARQGDAAPPAVYHDLRLSPDGTRIAVMRNDPEINDNLWSIAPGGGVTRLTNDSALARRCPVWSPDGKALAWTQPAQRAFSLFSMPLSGSSAQLIDSRINQSPVDWSPDGDYIVFQQPGPATRQDLWALPLKPRGEPFQILATPFAERFGRISPDGRWLAYMSDESGRFEVYVQSFPALISRAPASSRWTVSVEGGSEPIWRRDGKELFFKARNGAIMSAAVDATAESFHCAPPKLLFDAAPALVPEAWGNSYDVAPKGDRFILLEPVEKRGSRPLHVLINWSPAR
jgi:eukaryotic-like serine/threonine-protein kinase